MGVIEAASEAASETVQGWLFGAMGSDDLARIDPSRTKIVNRCDAYGGSYTGSLWLADGGDTPAASIKILKSPSSPGHPRDFYAAVTTYDVDGGIDEIHECETQESLVEKICEVVR